MGRALDLHCQRFGHLIASNQLKVIAYRSRGSTVRLCYCDCGKETWVVTSKLRNGHTTSCGCRKPRSLQPGRAARNQVLDGYRRGAKRRGLEWSLSNDEFDILTSACCWYCHMKPQTVCRQRGNNGSFLYNGIDRRDNTKGYTMDNCVTCCIICNRAKRDMSFEDFQRWLMHVSHVYHGALQ